MTDEGPKRPDDPDVDGVDQEDGPESGDAPEEGSSATPPESTEPADDSSVSDDDAEQREPAEEEEDEAAAAKAAAEAKAAAAAKAKAEREAAEAAKPAWERDPATPEWEDASDDPLARALRQEHGDRILESRRLAEELILDIARDAIREVAASLKRDHGFGLLVDICGSHYPDREEGPEFEVVYNLYNLETERRVLAKVGTDADAPVPTVVGVWKGANWPEREIYDMYGVRFADHPDMTRILMWEGFEGHPLRKDFPVEGIATGAAIYPEYYTQEAGPVTGTGTGWRPAPPEVPQELQVPEEEESGDDA